MIIDSVKEELPIAVFILQPANPIYQATFYPLQVDALKKYAETNGIVYLNHWKAWPDPDSEAIKDYLSADESQPNAEGHEDLAKYVTNYLIAKE